MINKRLESLTKNNSAIRAMFEEGNRLSSIYGKANVFDFSLGNPVVETPVEVKNEIIKALATNDSMNLHGYMPNAGYLSVREAIASNLNSRFSMDYSATNIVLTVGAAGGLNCILQTLLNPNDQVIVCAPFFVEYENYIHNWNGEMVVAYTNQENFSLSRENISKCITEKTKAIIINNPNNPTGVVYSEENIKEICTLLSLKEKEFGHPIYIISDEPYRELSYDGVIVPFIPKYYKNCIVVYSWSKSLSLPGERIGYIAITPDAVDSELIWKATVISNRIIGFVNAPSLMQHTIEKTLSLKPNIDLYDSNRKYLFNKLSSIGYSCVYPQGAFYLWLKAPCDEKWFINEAKKYHILLVPGSSFYGDGYVRIAYCVSKECVRNSIDGFIKLWDSVTIHNRG